MEEKELVSVIMPTYKQDELLYKAVESVLNQTYKNIELIVIDDNVDSIFYEKNKKFFSSLEDKRVVYLKNEINLGSAKTRNRGIMEASGEYITFLDDDDIYLESKVENQIKIMKKMDADFSITDMKLCDEEGKLVEHKQRYYLKRTDKESLVEYHLKYHITGTDTMMFKKDYLCQINGFDEIDLGDEFYLMMKAIQAGGQFAYVPCCDVVAIVHRGEVGLSSGKNKIICENQLFEYKKKFFKTASFKCRKYIRMRHYAVLAFAYIRMNKLFRAMFNAALSFFCSPINSIILLLKRKF